MNLVPTPIGASTPPKAPTPILDTRVSNQQIDVTLAGNLNIGTIFTGSVSASDVGYWLDAMAYSDQFEQVVTPTGTILGFRFGYGLRILFRVRTLSGKANLNYELIGASIDAGLAQASYEIDGFGFGAQTNQALAMILDGIASSGTTLDGNTFYSLNAAILKNLAAFIAAQQANLQPVKVATLVTNTTIDKTFNTSRSILYAMRQIGTGKTLEQALTSAGDLDSTGIRLAYEAILSDASPQTQPTGANENAAAKWLADN